MRPPSRRTRQKRLDPESLLRIPLVRRTFSHPTIRPRARAFDRTWFYQELVNTGRVGFVPFRQDVFYAAISRTASWRRNPEQSARPLNEDDLLVHEVFFCVHDFLHAWSLATLREVAPHLRIGPGLSDAEREELAYAHLVTEAVASVGLDYWYLSVVDPNDVCPIGTKKFPLTNSYEERHLAEYRRARPRLAVQKPAFLAELVTFYCDGAFRGFDREHLARSPRLASWLKHEVVYGERQRTYIRQWLAFVTGATAWAEAPGRPVMARPRWGRELVALLSERLWRLVKEDVDAAPQTPSDVPFEAPAELAFDPRFVNVRALPPEDLLRTASAMSDPKQLAILCDQYVCTYERARFETELLYAFVHACEAKNPFALHGLLRKFPRLEADPQEPTYVFVLG